MLIRAALAVFKKDIRIAIRRIGENLTGIMFFVLALALFPIGVGASPELLTRIGSGIIWVLALFSVMLSLERFVQVDFEDGSLEQMLLSKAPLELLLLAKAAAHWVMGGLMLVLISPFLALLMSLPKAAYWAIPVALLVGTPSLILIGGVGATLLLGSRRTGALLALIVLPLYIPVLIFGVAATDGFVLGLGGAGQIMVLGAIALAAIALSPFAMASAVRSALES